ncbi:MAG: archaetidylserine decarboxylase [Betaproteobacteria bacterium]
MSRRAVLPQYFYPKRLLTNYAGFIARNEWGWYTTRIIRNFIRDYDVDMSEAVQPDPTAYKTFNAFFTRALKPGARPVAHADLICPVDGAISQYGRIDEHRIFQAKGHDYTTQALLGGDPTIADPFIHGSFATIYLSPKDYHRIHMPCDGRLVRMIHVPGSLFSVNPVTAAGVPGLWARNERVVCMFEGPRGPWVLVLVGATIVGSMQTVWHGVVNPKRPGKIREWRYDDQAISLKQGEEMGRFLLGSTVIMVFPKDDIAFNPAWAPAKGVRLGEEMANYRG